MIRGVTPSAYDRASEVNDDVVIKAPLLARLPCNAPKKLLDLGATDGIGATLRLDVDQVQPKLVFADHAIDAFVSALAKVRRRLLADAAVPHRAQYVQHEPLEELRRLVRNPLEQIGEERRADRLLGGADLFLGRVIGAWQLELVVRRASCV